MWWEVAISGFLIAELVLAILLTLVILVQQQGVGLGGAFGGEGNIYRSRRGVERWLFTLTIILGITFFTLITLSVALGK